MEVFEFQKWCEEFEIEEETAKLLREKDFKSDRSISKMTIDIMKKEFKSISPGQMVLLQEAVSLLQPAAKPSSSPITNIPNTGTTDPGTVEEAQGPPQDTQQPDLFQLWGLEMGVNREQLTQSQTGKPHFDPFGLGTGPYANKLRQIGDYITHMTSADPTANNESVKIGGVEFVVAKGKRVPMDKIKTPHFMEAALRILRELIIEDSLPPAQVINHINYLIQIACLAQTHAWNKVLNYDTIYRREQSHHGFAWGSNSAFLLQSQFMTHETRNQAPSHSPVHPTKSRAAYVTHPSTGRQVCEKFNTIHGCTFPKCRFEHACKKCFESTHNVIAHNNVKNE